MSEPAASTLSTPDIEIPDVPKVAHLINSVDPDTGIARTICGRWVHVNGRQADLHCVRCEEIAGLR